MNNRIAFFSLRSYALAVALGLAYGAIFWVSDACHWGIWPPRIAGAPLMTWAFGCLPLQPIHWADRVSRFTAAWSAFTLMVALLGSAFDGPAWRQRELPGFLIFSGALAVAAILAFALRRGAETRSAVRNEG